MKNLFRALLIPAAMLCALAINAHAQSPDFNGIGSSALFLEVGEAAFSANSSSCAWSTGTNGQVVATDTSTGSSLTDTGSSWVVWIPAGANTCATDATPAAVYGYLQTDSVVGNRCLFNAQASGGPFCSISYAAAAGTSPAGKIEGGSEVVLPATVAASLTGHIVNYAGTDIRPEDGLFATTRALTPCGSTAGPTGSIAPYLGLGYTNGSDIASFYSSSVFHVINFSLPSTYFVQPVGLDPLMVVINSTDASGIGFNSPTITSITKDKIALYLDGSIGSTNGLLGGTPTASNRPVTVVVREPLSGTYNTMEYNAPNTSAMKTSQDVGVLQLPSQINCSGAVPASNPMHIANAAAGSVRNRAIGTGQELTEAFATNDSFAYAFWGVSNFASAPSTAKYLLVENTDPIQSGWTGGTIPTAGNGLLSKVTFVQLSNGSYPLWSLVRLVTADSASNAVARNLALAAANFSTSTHPDFVPYYTTHGALNLLIERSHFAPPSITFSATNLPNNGSGVAPCSGAESGGDVGGVITRIFITDYIYCHDSGLTSGVVGRRY